MTQAPVEHHPAKSCFTLTVDNKISVLEYRLSEQPSVSINFVHTYVPQELRGQGIAEKLVRSGLSWAREQGYPITASCWYVAKFLR